MKHLPINSTEFKHSLLAFKAWLQTLGYSENTITTYSNQLNEFLHYLEVVGVHQLKGITATNLRDFVEHVKTRPNTTHGGGLSTAHINSMINALAKFMAYLKAVKQITIPVEFKRDKPQQAIPAILSKEEVLALLDSMDNAQNPFDKRDRAMIGLLYGAGLRLSELYHLNVEDISLENRSVFIQYSKTKTQRLVPLTNYTLQIIKQYLAEVRDTFTSITSTKEEALFIDIHGKRIPYDTCYAIIKRRAASCHIASIEDKNIHPHVFRHSVATHLCQAGMQMEDLAKFLGHRSLDSTMIYAHLASTLNTT